MEIKIVDYEIHGDDRGSLVALEENISIPFSIKRVYYMYNTKENVSRGHHAHRKLKQILICISGECKVLLDDGTEKKVVILKDKTKGLFIGPGIWREMFDFSKGSVLLVLASECYAESDYIRNYKEFIEYIGQNEG